MTLGFFLIGLAALVLVLIYGPIFKVEVGYQFKRPQNQAVAAKSLAPVDSQFGLMIPKIGANAKVIANVDPYQSAAYQVALTKGVAHAKGTAFPGEPGNVFIFSHSSADFYQATRYNAIFYLLDKLAKGDDIYLFYQGEKFRYQVTEKKTVDPSEIKYLSSLGSEKTVTLMTCWPPGTNLKRLMVIGKIAPLLP